MVVDIYRRAQDPHESYILFCVSTTTHCLTSFQPDHTA